MEGLDLCKGLFGIVQNFQKYTSTGANDAKTLRAKARERAAKASRKVQKSVPTTSFVAWHSWTVAHAYGFLDRIVLAFTVSNM